MDITTAKLGANMAIDELSKSGQIGSTITSKEIIFPSTALEFVVLDEDTELCFAPIGADAEMLAKIDVLLSESITFTFDGIKYLCSVVDMGENKYWGNLGFLGMEDTGEPFILGFDNNQGFVLVCPIAGMHTVEISLETETLKPINPKYIYPHFDLAAMGMPTASIGGGTVYVTSDEATMAEINAAMDNGLVTASFMFNIQGMDVLAHGVFPCFSSESFGERQGCCMASMSGTAILFVLRTYGGEIMFEASVLGA